MSATVSSSLPFRMRPDLEVVEISSGALRMWTVKDPIALRYYQLRAEEFAVLRLLDGQRSAEEVVSGFRREFPEQRLHIGQLQVFLSQLAAQGLLIHNLPGHGQRLYERAEQLRTRSRRNRWANPFAIRLTAFDPTGLVHAVYPYTRVLFSRTAQTLLAWAVLLTAVFMLASLRTLESRLPTAESFLTGQNLVWMIWSYAVAKTLHELGHALTCRHFRCDCHEMGVMLLVFAPCLYCDVSDGWVLPERWKRLAISAAGIIVELYLAAICAWLWYFSEPGLMNSLCLNMVLVCTVSTLAFNANPLLRFDGYYMLADWLGIPNLRQNAQRVAADLLARVVHGVRAVSQRMLFPRHQLLLAVYWLASVIYRAFVVWALVWGLDFMLHPWGLRPVALAVGGWLVLSLVLPPIKSVSVFAAATTRGSALRTGRSLFGGGLLLVLVLAILFLPWGQRLRVLYVIEPQQTRLIHAGTDGRVIQSVPIGTRVTAGTPIITLENSQLQRELLRLTGQVAQVEQRLDSLTTRQVRDPVAAAEIPATRERLEDLKRRRESVARQVQRLTIVAPTDGEVLPVRPRREEPSPGDLQNWTGSPLDAHNRGCFVERETLLCQLGHAELLEAYLLVEQSELAWIERGQRVDLYVVEDDRECVGRVTEIAPMVAERVPVELLDDRWIPLQTGPDGTMEPVETLYRVRVEFVDRPRQASINSVGIARIHLRPLSLWDRCRRSLSRSFQSLR